MACPFTRSRDSLSRQQSTVEGNWNIDEYLNEAPDDALTLTHLQSAIQLLTTPSVCPLSQSIIN
jgi:guanylate cyclase soluble subunit alpha